MIVADSSPLIALGKLGRLGIIRKCFKQLVIPETVYSEVLLKKDSPEAIALKKAVEENWVVVEKVAVTKLLTTQTLGNGEKEAISLAAKHNALVLIDDDSAKAYASVLGVDAHGTFYIVYLSCLKGFISKSEAVDILNCMVAGGFYISTEIYSKFFELLNSIK